MNLPFRGDYRIYKYVHKDLKKSEESKFMSRLELKVGKMKEKLELIISEIIKSKLGMKGDSSINIPRLFDVLIKKSSK